MTAIQFLSRRVACALTVAIIPAVLVAQPPATSARLTVERIFASGEFAARGAGQLRWLDDSTYVALQASPRDNGGAELARFNARTGARDVLVPSTSLTPNGASAPLDVEDYFWSPDHKRLLIFTASERVWRENTRGDYWVLDLASHQLRKLGGDAPRSTLMFAKFSPDGRRVAYVRQNDLYVEDVANGAITRLTRDGSRTTINGTFDWVYEEELSLRDGFRWSPDGKSIAYWQLDASGVRDFNLIDDTDSLYSFVTPVQYPKAGTTNSAGRIGVVAAAGGPTTWLAIDGDSRNQYLARMDWAGLANSSELLIQRMNRPQNEIDVLLANARTGTVRTILVERDSAWVDVVNDVRWLNKDREFTWMSERDGWRRMYSVSRDGATVKALSADSMDVTHPAFAFGAQAVLGTDATGEYVYHYASPQNPTQLYLYRTSLKRPGVTTRVTPADQPGTHSYSISPNGRYAVHTWSSFGTPPTVELITLPDHKRVRVLQDNAELRARMAGLELGPREFFRVDIGDGVKLDGWMIKPPGFDSTKKYPVLFEVYGEPAAQTVTDSWGGGGYLWHLMLSQMGYIVMSVDNRGTPAPRGRAWRKAIYKRMGVLNAGDQAAAAQAIAKWPFVDARRLGVWGWSGGGSTTLNVMFRTPDVYRMGMAVAPVSDLHYYDTIYQERYVGLPQDNPEVYRVGSPVTFAGQLKGDLLVVHGSGDDNVHYQNTEALVNALVKANKPFQLMVYPNRTHCICEGEGTSIHLYSLLTKYLTEHLPVNETARVTQ
ncbi:MAG TPA: S9 family peptidase [Gemmatimonadaceae bacterium]|nr:S9 family peptidase [Gemmatimonadaceae bacterium]